jgi:hypothetical protein
MTTKWTNENRTPWKDGPPWSGRAAFRRIRRHEVGADRLPWRVLSRSFWTVSRRCLDLRDLEDMVDPNGVFAANPVHAWMFRESCERWAERHGKPCDPDGEFVWIKLFGQHCPDHQIDNEARIVIFKDEFGMVAALGEALVNEVMNS